MVESSKISHIERIIKEYMFDARKKSYPDACECYKNDKSCHDMKNLNCFFCYCPYYDTGKVVGGCNRDSECGKWLYSDKHTEGKIWDCSDCTYPHKKNVVKAHLKKIFSQKK